MADSLASLLGLTAQERLASDPFYLSGVQLQRQQITPTNNLEAVLIPALQGFAAGGLQGYGQAGIANSMREAASPLVQALKISPSAMESNNPFEVESAIKGALLDRQLSIEQAKLNNDFTGNLVDSMTKADPDRAIQIIDALMKRQAPAQELSKQTSLPTPTDTKSGVDADQSAMPQFLGTPTAPVAAQTAAPTPGGIDTSGVPNPNSPRVKALLAEEDAARKEIAAFPSVTQFMTMQKTLPLVAGFKDQNTKSSDVGFVYNFVKSLDDGAVRGEEINMAQSSNPIVQQYRGILEGALTGASTLTPELKNAMYSELLSAQKNVHAQAVLDAQRRFEIAKGRGVTNFNNLLTFDPNLTFGGGGDSTSGAMDARTFALKAKEQGLTKEQARAEWSKLQGQ